MFGLVQYVGEPDPDPKPKPATTQQTPRHTFAQKGGPLGGGVIWLTDIYEYADKRQLVFKSVSSICSYYTCVITTGGDIHQL